MNAKDAYCAARDYADDCFKVMLDLWAESVEEHFALVGYALADNALVYSIRKAEADRTIRAFEAALENSQRADDQRHEAFDRWCREGAIA